MFKKALISTVIFATLIAIFIAIPFLLKDKGSQQSTGNVKAVAEADPESYENPDVNKDEQKGTEKQDDATDSKSDLTEEDHEKGSKIEKDTVEQSVQDDTGKDQKDPEPTSKTQTNKAEKNKTESHTFQVISIK